MKVVVTGGAGFVGSHVADRLLAEGHEVTVIDNLSTGHLANLPRGVRFEKRDIRSPVDVLFREVRPDVLIHAAAQVSVARSCGDPGYDLDVNVRGTINVVTAAAKAGARKIIFISSAAVYGRPTELPLREGHPSHPLSPYGLSKLAGEYYVEWLCKMYGTPFTILRPANIYGPRQRCDGEGAVIPAFVSSFLQGMSPTIHGNGLQTRDFIYVDDVVRAILSAMKRADNMVLNIGTGQSTSILDLWKLLARLCDWTQEPLFGPPREGDIPHSILDSQRAQLVLGWSPTVHLSQGLAETVNWFRRFRGLSTMEQG